MDNLERKNFLPEKINKKNLETIEKKLTKLNWIFLNNKQSLVLTVNNTQIKLLIKNNVLTITINNKSIKIPNVNHIKFTDKELILYKPKQEDNLQISKSKTIDFSDLFQNFEINITYKQLWQFILNSQKNEYRK